MDVLVITSALSVIMLTIARFHSSYYHLKEPIDWALLTITSIDLYVLIQQLKQDKNTNSWNYEISILLYIGVVIFMFSFREYYENKRNKTRIGPKYYNEKINDKEKVNNKNRIYLITGLSISGVSILLFGLNYMLSNKK
jgi:uncharacterized membrane protein